MRMFTHLKIISLILFSLALARPALADFETAAGYWKLLGQQKQVPQLLNLRGTRDIAILEVVGDCGGALCSWGATRADLLFDADGNVVRWQASLQNGDDFHEFDAFVVNGEIVMDYMGDFSTAANLVTATLIFGSVTEAEIAAMAGGSSDGGGDEAVLEGDTDDAVADGGTGDAGGTGDGSGGTGTGPSLEEQIVTGGLILGGLLLLNELLDNGGSEPPAPDPAPAPADPADLCGMEAVKPYMNKRYTDIPAALIKPGDRVHSNRDSVTMDLRPTRLNVVYRFANKKVFKLGCY